LGSGVSPGLFIEADAKVSIQTQQVSKPDLKKKIGRHVLDDKAARPVAINVRIWRAQLKERAENRQRTAERGCEIELLRGHVGIDHFAGDIEADQFADVLLAPVENHIVDVEGRQQRAGENDEALLEDLRPIVWRTQRQRRFIAQEILHLLGKPHVWTGAQDISPV